MEEKFFAQAIADLNQRMIQEITGEVLHCWRALQQGGSVDSVTAHIENPYMKESVTHALFYLLVQTLLYKARRKSCISETRYKELRTYLDGLASLVGPEPLQALSLRSV